jgi:hypothetical protein
LKKEKGDSRVFYMQPNSPFLKEPRTQNVYRNEFIRSIGQPPTPEPITLIADDLHKVRFSLLLINFVDSLLLKRLVIRATPQL